MHGARPGTLGLPDQTCDSPSVPQQKKDFSVWSMKHVSDERL